MSVVGNPVSGPVVTGSSAVPRFAHIDAMRAAAVILVVLAHGGLGDVIPGGSGVTVFFTISGFIITFLVLRERDKTSAFAIGPFYYRRVLKIVPPLLIAIVVPTLVYALWNPVDWRAFAGQLFFYYNWYKAAGGAEVLPGTGVVWSLSIEEQFYIVFALLWLVFVRSRFWRPLLVATAVIAVAGSTSARILLAIGGSSSSRIYYGSDTRLDGIAWGVLVAVAYHSWVTDGERETKVTRLLASPVSLISALLLYLVSVAIRDDTFRDTARYSVQSLCAALVIVYGFMCGRGRVGKLFDRVVSNRFVALIGLASYSIYLVHLVLMLGSRSFTDTWPEGIALPVLVVVGVGAGILVYQFVEVPVLRWRKMREARNRSERRHRAADAAM
ncbi:O-acetyltransferase OatA [Rhodococcus ruber]|uniref:acyltransferase family protein n=1 Tax=Rhodococcus ruber TaxID=1830 RepID=UPI00315D5C3B